ncbi:MAG: PepSY domain-containing protein [Gemmatimonadaceae bacterium]
MKPAAITSLFALCSFAAVASAGAQSSTSKADVPAKLAHEAKITLDSARTIAKARLPKATVQSEELEREGGKLIYSFDMKTAGRSGIDEVNVNAMNGKLVGKVGHEGPADEAKEAKAEHEKPTKKPN